MPGPRNDALGVDSVVVFEQGRWVVYLVVTMWNAAATEQPFERLRHRIRDYATRDDADIAAAWMQRAAARERRSPPDGLR